jgi:hypothetical protein
VPPKPRNLKAPSKSHYYSASATRSLNGKGGRNLIERSEKKQRSFDRRYLRTRRSYESYSSRKKQK